MNNRFIVKEKWKIPDIPYHTAMHDNKIRIKIINFSFSKLVHHRIFIQRPLKSRSNLKAIKKYDYTKN